MKKIVTAIVIFFLSSVSFADDQERELDKLFLELKKIFLQSLLKLNNKFGLSGVHIRPMKN
jgi:hypothetical protein